MIEIRMVLLSLLIFSLFYLCYLNGLSCSEYPENPKNVWCTVLLFPNLGLGGCKIRCIEKEGKETATYVAAFYKENHDWPEELVKNMKVAASILKRYGQPKTLDKDRGRHLHISFDYYCCYTEEEAVKIGKL